MGHITLIGPTNEGTREVPAVFRFMNCFDVAAITPGIASPDPPMARGGTAYADGMLFENCRDFTVIQPMAINAFTQLEETLGDASARAIRITSDCRHGVVKGLHCNHLACDTDIQNDGRDCFVEAPSDAREA